MAIYYCKAGASGSNSGTESDPWQSLADITGLSSGDTVRLSGKFRESLTPVDGVTYEQWEGEDRWIVDGSDVMGGPWTGPDGNGEYYTEELSNDPNVVFSDDTKLTEGTLGSLASDEWAWDSANSRLYLGFNPSGHTIEAGVRSYGVDADPSGGCVIVGAQSQRNRYRPFQTKVADGATVILQDCVSIDAGDYGYFCIAFFK